MGMVDSDATSQAAGAPPWGEGLCPPAPRRGRPEPSHPQERENQPPTEGAMQGVQLASPKKKPAQASSPTPRRSTPSKGNQAGKAHRPWRERRPTRPPSRQGKARQGGWGRPWGQGQGTICPLGWRNCRMCLREKATAARSQDPLTPEGRQGPPSGERVKQEEGRARRNGERRGWEAT